MCKWGTNTEMEIAGRTVKVDYCLATLLALLNSAGMPTVASCCGHGKTPGRISLEDGRELIISPDMATTQKMFGVLGEE
jgi:hypothetical protein